MSLGTRSITRQSSRGCPNLTFAFSRIRVVRNITPNRCERLRKGGGGLKRSRVALLLRVYLRDPGIAVTIGTP
jgi:hypothetical protein